MTSSNLWWTLNKATAAVGRSFSPYVWANRWLMLLEWLETVISNLSPKFANGPTMALWGLRMLLGGYWLSLGLHTVQDPLWPRPIEGWLHLWGPTHPWFLAQDILSKMVLPALNFWGSCASVLMVTLGLSLLLGLVMIPVLLTAFSVFGMMFLIAAPVDPVLAAWMLALMLPIPCLLGARSQWVLGVDWWTAPYKELKHAGLLKKAPSKKKLVHAPKHISPLEGHRFTRMGPNKVLHDDEMDNDPDDDLDTDVDWRKPSRGGRSSGATVTELKPTASQAKVNAMLDRFTLPAEEDDEDRDDWDDDE
ncbi:MAG: hypothetical protein QE263_05000 [Vampirovibrionales bacterium]|nr:hypothetical protein [Vampirovibrionales bacterium]